MRIKKSLKNIIYSLATYLLLMVLGVFTRKLFIQNFSVELLGCESLFGSLFVILSMAEMGAGSMFSYMLYKAVAGNDTDEIGVLMQMYKHLYRIVGCIVALLGGILAFFLPLFVHAEHISWNYIYLVYFIQLLTTLSTYFLAYRRALMVAFQCEYQAVRIETIYKIINTVCRICAIAVLRSYLAYLLIAIFCNIGINLHIWYRCGKQYPYIRSAKVTLDDYKKRNVFKELKNILVTKVATTLWSSSDNVLISGILGVGITGIYGNYMQIYSAVITVLNKCIQPIQASIGNLIYTEDKEKTWRFYQAFDLLFGFLASFCFVSFTVVFQPFIEFVYGEAFLLPLGFVVACAANGYVAIKQQANTTFRGSLGKYHLDVHYSVLSAAVNIALSIILAVPLGITGIAIGTVVAHLFIAFGRFTVVYRHFFQRPVWQAAVKEGVWITVTAAETVALCLVCKNIPITFTGLLLRAVACVLVPNIVNLIVFYNTPSFKMLLAYLINVLTQIKGNKISEQN